MHVQVSHLPNYHKTRYNPTTPLSTMVTKLVLITAIISHLIVSTAGISLGPIKLTSDPSTLHLASVDFGLMSQAEPLAVLRPNSARAISSLVKAAYSSSHWLPISARGCGHSTNGQAQAKNGVVVEMTRDKSKLLDAAALASGPEQPKVHAAHMYVDAWGGELWVDVLRSTLEHGLAPKTWTDYLYLTVGGTLSNAGISGQTYTHGPQVSNVLQLQVVTGTGEIINCSEEKDSDLFHAVLGGLGQFGIITKARIALEPAPQMVRWMRLLYSNFTEFTRDQEYLISLHDKPANERFDYIEGFVIDEASVDQWISSFSNPQNFNISSLHDANNTGNLFYGLEITKNYFNSTLTQDFDQEVDALLKTLNFIPSSVFTTDVTYFDFLDRVHKLELELQPKGLWDVPHPWLNIFVPKSKIAEFNNGVFKGILGNKTSGTILIYPMNNNKWNQGTSTVTPDEDVFYLVGLLNSAIEGGGETLSLQYLSDENDRILEFCKQANIQVKQYLPHYTLKDEWMQHFGQKWDEFSRLKTLFDPRHILASGQSIFETNIARTNGSLLSERD